MKREENRHMIYRNYGTTGVKVSAIGFGGMRFQKPDDFDANASLVKAAYDSGISYFDTAPLYGKSEDIFGVAFKEMLRTRAERPFHVSTKTFKSNPSEIRADIETSLKRMGLDHVDFFHMWCLMRPGELSERRAAGALREFERLRDEGLVRHICVSAHMAGPEIAAMLEEHAFDGILLGYSPMNFAYREAGVEAAARKNIGVVVMNPLGGGIIPQHSHKFRFLSTRPGETVVEGALRFLLNDKRITCALVGLSDMAQLAEALRAVDGFHPLPPEQVEAIRGGLRAGFDHMCTGCGYCLPCPKGLAVPKLMDAYNQFVLTGRTEDIFPRLQWHWAISQNTPEAFACVACGECVKRCTQKLPIIERIAEIRNAIERIHSSTSSQAEQ